MNSARSIGGVLVVSLGYFGLGSGQERALRVDASDVRIVSSFVATGQPVPGECREEAHTLAECLIHYPRPISWHWVLLCDEAGWRRFLRLSGRQENEAIYASTDLEARTTYLRGAKLFIAIDLDAGGDSVIAHELAHIRLNSSDEQAAKELARAWLCCFGKGNTGGSGADDPRNQSVKSDSDHQGQKKKVDEYE